MRGFFLRLLVGGGLFLFTGCGSDQEGSDPNAGFKAGSAPVEASTAPNVIDETAIDTKVNRCEDFYHYACGSWLSKPLPSDKTSVYRDLPLSNLIDQTLEDVVAAYGKGDYSVPSTYSHLLGNYYVSCMNENSTAQKSLDVFHSIIGQIDSIKDKKSLAETVAELQMKGVNALFSFSADQDYNDANTVIGFGDQGGMALPDRDYYMTNDPDAKQLLQDYANHLKNIFVLMGFDESNAKGDSQTVLNLETSLASKALSLNDRQDPVKLNNPVGRSGLTKLTPEFDWNSFFSTEGLSDIQTITLREPEFFKNLNEVLKKTSLNDLKVYLKWEFASSVMNHLDDKFLNEYFQFWLQELNGQAEMAPAWKRCLGSFEGSMQEALGEAYVKKVFGQDQRDRVSLILTTVREAFLKNLSSVSWLDESTRKTAIDKLNKVGQKIGYPEKWKSLDGLQLVETSFLENLLSARTFESKRNLNKIGKPVDRSEWDMPPQEINAYYNEHLNEVVFPAGTLQPPYFDMHVSDGANYGSIGFTMGHELTHGFDENGSRYDATGTLKNWWSESVRNQFNSRAQCLIDQASAYPTGLDVPIRGQATLGENIADQGGAKLSLSAFLEIVGKRDPAPDYAGFNETQQFFVSYAQGWCNHRTKESLRNQLLSDVHPPAEYRVNGVLRNIPEFAKAFNCAEGKNKMAPSNRCGVW